jgi:hypothetical protein
MGDSLAYIISIIVGRRAHIVVKKLPMHMWTPTTMEQILRPYGALEYIDEETRSTDDPSSFMCVRCQIIVQNR